MTELVADAQRQFVGRRVELLDERLRHEDRARAQRRHPGIMKGRPPSGVPTTTAFQGRLILSTSAWASSMSRFTPLTFAFSRRLRASSRAPATQRATTGWTRASTRFVRFVGGSAAMAFEPSTDARTPPALLMTASRSSFPWPPGRSRTRCCQFLDHSRTKRRPRRCLPAESGRIHHLLASARRDAVEAAALEPRVARSRRVPH